MSAFAAGDGSVPISLCGKRVNSTNALLAILAGAGLVTFIIGYAAGAGRVEQPFPIAFPRSPARLPIYGSRWRNAILLHPPLSSVVVSGMDMMKIERQQN